MSESQTECGIESVEGLQAICIEIMDSVFHAHQRYKFMSVIVGVSSPIYADAVAHVLVVGITDWRSEVCFAFHNCCFLMIDKLLKIVIHSLVQ